MTKRLALFLFATLLLLASGCGGSDILGRNSSMVVRLMRTDGTQIMTQYELYITRNADTNLDTADDEDFMSTSNQPSWADNYSASRSATELQVAFTTRSNDTPYYVFVRVPNTGAQFETLRFRVDVDGDLGEERTIDLDINDTSRLTGVRIERNDAVY